MTIVCCILPCWSCFGICLALVKEEGNTEYSRNPPQEQQSKGSVSAQLSRIVVEAIALK